MRVAVIVFPGSNCDRDVAVALAACTGAAPAMVWHRETALPPLDLIVVPGGFSYGDYLRPGAMAAHSPIMAEVRARAGAGTPVVGICNGFQILTECGLLPGALIRNRDLEFLCMDTPVRVETTATPFTEGLAEGEVLNLPIAHNEGNYRADADTLARLEGDGRVVFRYCRADGAVDHDSAPNGAVNNIAGIVDRGRRVLGLMPHPERTADAIHGSRDGHRLLATIVANLS